MEKTAWTSLWSWWESFLCDALGCECMWMETGFSWPTIISAPGVGEGSVCSFVSAHPSFLHFLSHPEWCGDSWSSKRLESRTAGLPWALMKQSVPDWLWPSQGTGWPSSPQKTFTATDSVSVPLLQPYLFPMWLNKLQSGLAGVPPGTATVHAKLNSTLFADGLFHIGMTCLYGI